MRSNFALGRNLEEEYRLIEELMNTENRYHAARYKQLIADLKSKDELRILEAVTNLSTELSMAQEENFGALQLDFLIPELMNCLQMEHPEIMMHAAVSVNHILDIMPAAGKILVSCGGIEVLVQKMQNFEYIDVAESAIKSLEKISPEYGLAILNSGGMEMMLTMIDFFVSTTQKLIMSIVSNVFRLISSEAMLRDKIIPILPTVFAYTQADHGRQDLMTNMVARLSDRVARLCGEDYDKKCKYLEMIAQDKLGASLCIILEEAVESFDMTKVEQIETLLRTLNKFCYFSLNLCMECFETGIMNSIDKLISILETPLGKESQLSMLAYETISLVNSILALRANPNPLVAKIAAYIGIKITENSNVQARLDMFNNNPYMLESIVTKVGVRLPGIFDSSAGSLFKYLVLISFQKMIEFTDATFLKEKIDPQLIANFISKLTSQNDIMIIALTLLITELLITRLPDTYIILTREGVIDFIKCLSNPSEYNKLEAYTIAPKKYNPLDTLKQFTNSLNRLTAVQNQAQGQGQGQAFNLGQIPANAFANAGTSAELLATLEAESQRLEAIMQQLQGFRQPESVSNSDSNNESKTLSSAEEGNGSPGKSPKIKNSGSQSLNPPKTSSTENKLMTGLNTANKKENDEAPMEEEIPAEKAPATQQNPGLGAGQNAMSPGQLLTQPVEKLADIRKEIGIFAGEVYNSMKEEIQKKNLPYLIPGSIINKLEEISLTLEQNQWNEAEFGQKPFQKYLDVIAEFGRITNYELKISGLLTQLLKFIFDDALSHDKELKVKKDNSSGGTMQLESASAEKERPAEKTNTFKKMISRFKDEERKVDTTEKEKEKEKEKSEPEKMNIELSEQQCRTILGRIISFLHHFKKQKAKLSEEIHLQDFLHNLQEMLTNSDKFSLDIARNYQDYENTLNSDMRFLSQRTKFRVQYNPGLLSRAERKKNLTLPIMSKQKSAKEDDKKAIPSQLETQSELLSYKESVFKDVPTLALSVEQFGTLEVIEDYLLNKLNSKEDIAGGFFGRNFNDLLTEKFESNHEPNSDEDFSPTDKPSSNSSNNNFDLKLQNQNNEEDNSAGNATTNSSLSRSPQFLKSHSLNKTKYESKFVRNERRKWVDRATGREVNFKKYLELKFYLNGEEVDKNTTVYDITSKHRSKQHGNNVHSHRFMGGYEDLTLEYRVVLKNPETLDLSQKSRDKYRNLNNLCLDYKSVLQNLIQRIGSVDIKSGDQSLKEIIQMIVLIHELVALDKRITSASSVFNPILVDLKEKYGLEQMIDEYRLEALEMNRNELIPKTEFHNKKISSMVSKYLNDPLTLAANLVPEVIRNLCEQVPFLLDFNSKLTYYKNGCFHISRALYYIYHTNRARLKELESTRIGKIHKKKVKVARDRVMENAIVNFETYGYKKSVLDFEFQEEVGTGLGPTLEYYSIVANEMKNPEHNLWRNTTNNLLFPSPIDPYDLKLPDSNHSKSRTVSRERSRDLEKSQLMFRCMGTMLGRAILDERICDMPLHSVLWDSILDRPLFLEDVAKIDPKVGETVLLLQEIVNKKYEIEKNSKLSQEEKIERIQGLTFNGATIEDLALSFTFPGYSQITLIENGEDMPVTLSNLDQYVSMLARYTLVETIKSQIFAFREGFDKVIPLKYLKIFDNEEIEALTCGGARDEDWGVKTLEENLIPAHGYSTNSVSFKNFIQMLTTFTNDEKRAFLKFSTGAERLPFGGFKNLQPKLTVVKRNPNFQHEHPDEYLPSVMTCQNYIKLPDYSSLEVMKKRVGFAMQEGHNSFSLS